MITAITYVTLWKIVLKKSPSNFVDPGNYHLRRRKKIRWSEHDAKAHINNVQFARFIETGRILFLHGISSKARD